MPYPVAVSIAEVLQVPIAYLNCDRKDLADLLCATDELDGWKVTRLCAPAVGLTDD